MTFVSVADRLPNAETNCASLLSRVCSNGACNSFNNVQADCCNSMPTTRREGHGSPPAKQGSFLGCICGSSGSVGKQPAVPVQPTQVAIALCTRGLQMGRSVSQINTLQACMLTRAGLGWIWAGSKGWQRSA